MKREHLLFSHIDWLSKSYSYATHYAQVVPTEYEPFRATEMVKPAPHYNEAWRLRCGAQVHISYDKKQGCKLDMGGDALWNVRSATGWSDELILKILSRSDVHKRTTRIDYAFNLVGWGSAKTLIRAIRNKRYSSTMKYISGHEDFLEPLGSTVYFGAPQSGHRIRIYDKGAEMGMLWAAWVRVEAQYRENYAQDAAEAVNEPGGVESYARTRTLKAVRFPGVHWYNHMLTGETQKIRSLVKKQTSFEARMEQLMNEIVKKAEADSEQREYIENTFLPTLALRLLKSD